MQAFGNPQLELTGVVLEIVRLPDRQAVLQSRLQPCSLGISRIGNRCLERLAAGDAARQVGEGHNKAALIGVLYQLHAIRQSKIFIQCFHDSPRFL